MTLREENLAVLRGYFDAMSAGGPQAAMAFYHPEVVLEVPGTHPASGVYEGHAGIGRFGGTMAAVTDRSFRLVPHDLLASDEHVVTIATASARVGDASLEWRRVIVSEVQDGMLVHLRFFESDQAAVDALLGQNA
ncbi:MAG: nuclear transport factor 2 family protein [Microbacterium pygmaeum]